MDTRDLPADRAAGGECPGRRRGRELARPARALRRGPGPIYLRPDATTSAALRRLAGDGVRLGAFTDAPAELADLALAQLGAARRLESVETGTNALERLRAALGEDAPVARTRAELTAYAWPAAPPTGADVRRA